jgi:hypothetical protein
MIDALIHRIRVRQAEIKQSLADGMPNNWEAYQRTVGEYQGLQDALNMLDSILEEDKNED